MTRDQLSDYDWTRAQYQLRSQLDELRSEFGEAVVEETDEFVLFRDSSGGQTLRDLAGLLDVDHAPLSRRMHAHARKVYAADDPGDPWRVADPILVYKTDSN